MNYCQCDLDYTCEAHIAENERYARHAAVVATDFDAADAYEAGDPKLVTL